MTNRELAQNIVNHLVGFSEADEIDGLEAALNHIAREAHAAGRADERRDVVAWLRSADLSALVLPVLAVEQGLHVGAGTHAKEEA